VVFGASHHTEWPATDLQNSVEGEEKNDFERLDPALKPSFYSLASPETAAFFSEDNLFDSAPADAVEELINVDDLLAKTRNQLIALAEPKPVIEPTAISKAAKTPSELIALAEPKPVIELAAVSKVAKTPSELVALAEPKPSSPCLAYQILLDRFMSFYNAGNAAGFAGLYSTYANENKLQGRANIKTAYTKWFDSTQQRDLQLRRMTASAIGPERCRVVGSYRVSYQEIDGRQATQRGQIELILGWIGGTHRILQAVY
jgi:hypothetical protein